MNRIHPRHLVFPVIFFICINLAFITSKNSYFINKTPLGRPESTSIQHHQLSAFFPASIQEWKHYILQTSEKYSLDPDLIASVMLQESRGDPQALSNSGAVGLMQVMPSDGLAVKFLCKNGPCFSDRPTIEELINPELNIDYGARLLLEYIKNSGALREGLKQYGPLDVGYFYADAVIEIYEKSKFQ